MSGRANDTPHSRSTRSFVLRRTSDNVNAPVSPESRVVASMTYLPVTVTGKLTMHAVFAAPHTSTESSTVAPELLVTISHGLKVAVSRKDNVSPMFACTAYSFACLPGLCGAPQSLRAIALVSITSGVMVFSTHGMIVYVTCTLSGDPLAPGAAKAIVLRCVPTARPAGLSVARTTVDVTSLGGTVLPESESVTQVVSNVAVQVS